MERPRDERRGGANGACVALGCLICALGIVGVVLGSVALAQIATLRKEVAALPTDSDDLVLNFGAESSGAFSFHEPDFSITPLLNCSFCTEIGGGGLHTVTGVIHISGEVTRISFGTFTRIPPTVTVRPLNLVVVQTPNLPPTTTAIPFSRTVVMGIGEELVLAVSLECGSNAGGGCNMNVAYTCARLIHGLDLVK